VAAAAEEREEKRRARNSPGARLFGQAQYLKNQIHPECVLKLGLLAYCVGQLHVVGDISCSRRSVPTRS
jgi:hypothetical protein